MSPRFHANSDMAPIFMASADEDTDCSFEASTEFVNSVEAAGGSISFVEHYGAGHFFLRDPERAAKTKAALAAFFDANGY
jgi:dipeptidyl aminopeptidase/acylaminoacyl peptidase